MRAISKRAKINKTINVPSVSSLAPALALDAAALAGDRRRETEREREATNNSWWGTVEQRAARQM